jgi:hypothetical protein
MPIKYLVPASIVVLSSSVAQAQYATPEPFVADEPIDSYTDLAPRNAFEIGVQGGYTQPFGDLEQGSDISDVIDAGGEVALELNWRISPRYAFGGTARFHESVVDDQLGENFDVRGGSANIQGTFHLAPFSVADPYITLGAGYRVLSLVPEGPLDATIRHGFEFARAQVGLDFRVSRDVALGPNAGVAGNVFLWEDSPTTTGNETIDDPRPNAFVFAGLTGRFDLGGTRVSEGVYYGEYPRAKTVAAR